jgi:hypothetical protein
VFSSEDVVSSSCSFWLQPAGQLIWVDFLLHCPGLVVLACHAKKSQNIGVNKNIGARQDLTDFCQTLAVNISAPRHPIKKW